MGREQLLGELGGWCEREPEDGAPAGLWLVTGGGGFGKTRLAVEACREAEARGWTAGLLRPDVTERGKLPALAEWPGRLLIAVDYAESTPGPGGAAGRASWLPAPQRPAVRVMLLVRRRASRAELLELFNQQREEQLDALLRRAPVSRLEDAESEVDRLELFRQATRGLRPPSSARRRQPGCGAAAAGRAFRPAAVRSGRRLPGRGHRPGTDVDALSEADLLRALLAKHEAGHWDRLDKQRGLGLDPADRRAAVAVATLLGAEGEDEALTVARLVPHLGAEPRVPADRDRPLAGRAVPAAARAGSLPSARWSRTGSARSWPATCSASSAACWQRPSMRHPTGSSLRALTVTTRIARDDAAVNAQLRDALDDRLPDLIQRALSASDDGELLSAITTAMTASRPARGAAAAAGRFPGMLPVGSGPSRSPSPPWPWTGYGHKPAMTLAPSPTWPCH